MLVFLDIDGVIVPAKGWKSPEMLADGFPAFSSKATFMFRKLIANGGTVLLTTSHKAKFSLGEWKTIFSRRDIAVEKLYCLPPNTSNLTRFGEIVDWFNVNNVTEPFIIIDDDKSLNALPDFLKKHLVLTSPYIGLTEEHQALIDNILTDQALVKA